MTVEKKTLIAPQDIIGVGYDCKHCHSTYLVPLEKLSRITTSCPNCKEEWVSDIAPSNGVHSDASVLNNFTQSLKLLQTRNVGASIRLEIREPKKEPE
jgi:hypothetical protein